VRFRDGVNERRLLRTGTGECKDHRRRVNGVVTTKKVCEARDRPRTAVVEDVGTNIVLLKDFDGGDRSTAFQAFTLT
jgi:hypothetical protein